jgi:hypothetical protein
MSTYPVTIRRCQHIKVNGIQCGSPAKRNEIHCFFHEQCRLMSRRINMKFSEHDIIHLPTLEDANSIQLGLAEVMRLLVTQQIDHRTASLLLRALRTAAANVRFTSFEPDPTHIVIDPKCVENRPLGATAWSATEGRDYDAIETGTPKKSQLQENQLQETKDPSPRNPNLVDHESGPTPPPFVEPPFDPEWIERKYERLNNWKRTPKTQTTEDPKSEIGS